MFYLKDIKGKLYRMSLAWGSFRATISSASGYASWVSYVMQAMTLYYVSGLQVPLWLFLLVIIISVALVLLGERKITIPAAYIFMNRQTWDNYNPMREKLEEHGEKLNKIMKKLGIDE